MQKRWLLACAFLGLGCGSGGNAWDKPVKDLEGFKDKTCACKDKACVDRVQRDLADWTLTMQDTFNSAEKPPRTVMEKVDQIESAMRDCRHHIVKPVDVDKASEKPAVGSAAN